MHVVGLVLVSGGLLISQDLMNNTMGLLVWFPLNYLLSILVGFGLRDDLLMKLPLLKDGQFSLAPSLNFAYATSLLGMWCSLLNRVACFVLHLTDFEHEKFSLLFWFSFA